MEEGDHRPGYASGLRKMGMTHQPMASEDTGAHLCTPSEVNAQWTKERIFLPSEPLNLDVSPRRTTCVASNLQAGCVVA